MTLWNKTRIRRENFSLSYWHKVKNSFIPKKSLVLIPIQAIHMNEKLWKNPNEFIPERFDPDSKYFLTPFGKKRHPMSYSPFLGGRRICLGKTFAENVGRSVLAIVLS